MPSTNLDIDYLAANQNQPEVVVNDQLDKLETAITDQLVHDMASDADYTLSTATDPEEWQYAFVKITDSGVVLTTARNIIVPTKQKFYLFENATAQSLTIKTSGGSGIAVAAGRSAVVWCDGTNVINAMALQTDELSLTTGLNVQEGSNARMGTATLVAGTVTVNTTSVAANSRVFLTVNTAGGTVGSPYVSARVAGTSFTITSTSGADTSTVAWLIVDPA